MRKHILDVVDMQGDFMRVAGKLHVRGAEKLINRTNRFFKALAPNTFHAAIFKYDTHFANEYNESPEKLVHGFPDHCVYGTDGWKLAVDWKLLKGKLTTYFMSKNTFDMWQDNPLPAGKVPELNPGDETRAYHNLYNVTEDPNCLEPGLPRDTHFQALGPDLEVTLIGVASEFCDRDAMLGYLRRGARVNVVEDLVRGISKQMREVVAEPEFHDYVESGQLRLVKAVDYLPSRWAKLRFSLGF